MMTLRLNLLRWGLRSHLAAFSCAVSSASREALLLALAFAAFASARAPFKRTSRRLFSSTTLFA